MGRWNGAWHPVDGTGGGSSTPEEDPPAPEEGPLLVPTVLLACEVPADAALVEDCTDVPADATLVDDGEEVPADATLDEDCAELPGTLDEEPDADTEALPPDDGPEDADADVPTCNEDDDEDPMPESGTSATGRRHAVRHNAEAASPRTHKRDGTENLIGRSGLWQNGVPDHDTVG